MQLDLPFHEEDSEHNGGSLMKDFICQTTKHLSTNTPRKKKQSAQTKKIRCLQEALKKKQSMKRGRNEQTLEEAIGKLPENLSHFVRMHLKLHSRKAKGRRYSPKMKSIAVSLYHASGKVYRILSKLFILPTKSSLFCYISKMPAATGISQGALNIIKKS